jgi:hypothetical protein
MAARKKTARGTKKTNARKTPARGAARKTRAHSKRGHASAVPSLFRLNVEVGNLEQAATFYETLFGITGRRHPGARVYVECGPVTLQVVDVSGSGTPHPAAKALYFLTGDLDAVFARAQALRCLSMEAVHGEPGGEIRVRPWGERSFYAEDPWRNPLCFVESGTVYPA